MKGYAIQSNVKGADGKQRIEFVYTGDTTFAGLLKPGLDFIFRADILVIEVTYLDGSKDKAAEVSNHDVWIAIT